VKRSGRDESIWVVTYFCMKAMLGISLILTSKNVFLFLLLLMSSLQQNWRKGQNRFCLDMRGGGEERKGEGGRNGPNNV
jgi:hypothetical protein